MRIFSKLYTTNLAWKITRITNTFITIILILHNCHTVIYAEEFISPSPIQSHQTKSSKYKNFNLQHD
jgi:hypothetical protein